MSLIRILALLLPLLTVSISAHADQKLDADAFMQMLMTQMKYQDPSKPMDQAVMVQQLSSLTMMQQNAELVTVMKGLSTQVYQSQGLYASGLVGKKVMVVASIFKVEDGRHPTGDVLLTASTAQLVVNVYKSGLDPARTDPLAELKLGAQKKGRISFELADLEKNLEDGDYQMRAYAISNGNRVEQSIAQSSIVKSVVVPGQAKDVLVDLVGIGLVPLFAVTEFQGEPEKEQQVAVAALTASGQNRSLPNLNRKAASNNRNGETWTQNPFYNSRTMKKQLGRKPATLRDSLFRTL
ncbi:hypothetical protein EOPP23_13125 [Endozoicomonas sp. OPT23]|uniref:flagellar hook assembly protein FlgD n=1 Tax=Endozoicomonas sp. OPT23 TaxID=2072845 RepID=UPI00129A9103|nr:flagellar hook capping FlgD N-terminal domain-containing protein [Endozoicomonas sp. OPT23]MRI33931.1 hypothetical protein [Endozoicomonas sp. OPT23]